MAKHAALVAYALTMVVVIVGVDVLLFRHHFWPRLMVNVGIVLIFGAFYVNGQVEVPRWWPRKVPTPARVIG